MGKKKKMAAAAEYGFELSEQDKADLALLGEVDEPERPGEQPKEAPKHTVLEVWRELLSNIDKARSERVDPHTANRIVTNWPKLSYADIPAYWSAYYDRLEEIHKILLAEIERDPAALQRVDNDAEENLEHYLNLLLLWQEAVLLWQREWDVTSPDAALTLAAMADAQTFVLGDKGLVAHLDAAHVALTADDNKAMLGLLTEWAEGL